MIRNWYTRKPEVIKTADWIVQNAKDCAQACVEGKETCQQIFEICKGKQCLLRSVVFVGDIEKIGKCLNNSWEQKKIIAPGTFLF